MGRSDQKGGVDRLRFGKVPSGHCVEDRREAGAEGRRLALHYCNLPGERWGWGGDGDGGGDQKDGILSGCTDRLDVREKKRSQGCLQGLNLNHLKDEVAVYLSS